MIKSNTTTPSAVNLNLVQSEFPIKAVLELQNAISALNEYAELENDQHVLQLVSKSCNDAYLELLAEIHPNRKA